MTRVAYATGSGAAVVRQAHRCQAPGCPEWACIFYGQPIWAGPVMRFCWPHRGIAEERIRESRQGASETTNRLKNIPGNIPAAQGSLL